MTKLKTRGLTIIDLSDWDDLVQQEYKRPYSFQQQDDCKERQMFEFDVPDQAYDYENDTVPEKVNDDKMGVSFAAWLARDPAQKITDKSDYGNDFTELWWHRNFYPDMQMIANDLHAKGLLEAGHYGIDIDW